MRTMLNANPQARGPGDSLPSRAADQDMQLSCWPCLAAFLQDRHSRCTCALTRQAALLFPALFRLSRLQVRQMIEANPEVRCACCLTLSASVHGGWRHRAPVPCWSIAFSGAASACISHAPQVLLSSRVRRWGACSTTPTPCARWLRSCPTRCVLATFFWGFSSPACGCWGRCDCACFRPAQTSCRRWHRAATASSWQSSPPCARSQTAIRAPFVSPPRFHPKQALMREQVRNMDRALSNIESMPGGFNALAQFHSTMQVRSWGGSVWIVLIVESTRCSVCRPACATPLLVASTAPCSTP